MNIPAVVGRGFKERDRTRVHGMRKRLRTVGAVAGPDVVLMNAGYNSRLIVVMKIDTYYQPLPALALTGQGSACLNHSNELRFHCRGPFERFVIGIGRSRNERPVI